LNLQITRFNCLNKFLDGIATDSLKDSIQKLEKLLKIAQKGQVDVFTFEFHSFITFNASLQSKADYFLNLLQSASAATNIRSLAKEATEQMETSKLRLTSLDEHFKLSQAVLDPLLDIYVSRESTLDEEVKKLRVELEEQKQKLTKSFDQFRAITSSVSQTKST